MRHLPGRPAVEPTDLNLTARQARARQLNTYDHGIVEVLNTDAQHIEDVSQHLSLAREAIQTEARRYWPEQEWQSTSTGGPPCEGDLHVKVASVITGDGNRVELRVGISAIVLADEEALTSEGEGVVTTFGPEATIFVPLALAEKLIACLEEHVEYWRSNPPPGADEAVTERPDR